MDSENAQNVTQVDVQNESLIKMTELSEIEILAPDTQLDDSDDVDINIEDENKENHGDDDVFAVGETEMFEIENEPPPTEDLAMVEKKNVKDYHHVGLYQRPK